MEEGPKQKDNQRAEGASTASNLGKLKCPYALHPKPGRQGQESPATVWATGSSAHAHGLTAKAPKDRHRGEGVNVCPVLGRMWKGRRTGPSKPGGVAEGQKGAQDLGMRGSSRWRE